MKESRKGDWKRRGQGHFAECLHGFTHCNFSIVYIYTFFLHNYYYFYFLDLQLSLIIKIRD